MAYFHFRHGLPLAPRSLLYPVIGRRIYGPVGHAVDILATVGTLFGVATSLGLGAMQINAGIARLTAIPQDPMVQVTISIIVIAVSPEALVFILGAAGEHLSLLIYPAGLPAEARRRISPAGGSFRPGQW